jgi:tetratricopeptide (TPR) repeat protein
MDLRGRSIALYGRFAAGQRERLAAEIVRRGGHVVRDLTRRSDAFVIGVRATALIDSGALAGRIAAARARNIPVQGERSFAVSLESEPPASTLPLETALTSTRLTRDDAEILSAFDLIALQDGKIRFGDPAVIRTADDMMRQGKSLAEAVRILLEARDAAPRGRRRVVLTQSGTAALQWDDGLSTLKGQGLLPLDAGHADLDEMFEAAEIADLEGRKDDAVRLFDMCARADPADAIALYNLGNIHLARNETRDAMLAYRRAIAREPNFVEARYNLALALEAEEKFDEASDALAHLLDIEPAYSDAVFNRARLLMKAGHIAHAKALYERYLVLDPPADWAATARKAIAYCAARLSA